MPPGAPRIMPRKPKYTVCVPLRLTEAQYEELKKRTAMYEFPSLAAFIRFKAVGEPRR